jgi:hypothetical protein
MEERRDKNNQDDYMKEDQTEAEPGEPGAVAEEEPQEQRQGILETFRQAYRRAKYGQGTRVRRPAVDPLVGERAARNRDRTRTMFAMVASVVVLLVIFLGLFSSSESDAKRQRATRRGTPSLGRPENQAPGKSLGSVTPLLEAELKGQAGPSDQLSPEDISGTARARAASRAGKQATTYADPALVAYRRQLRASGAVKPPAPAPQTASPPVIMAQPESGSLAKASLVYVRDNSGNTSGSPSGGTGAVAAGYPLPDNGTWPRLPIGTRLVARLQTAVSTAVKAAVLAVIEAHYERDGEIIVPAGTKAVGELQSAGRSGLVGIRFHTLQMPDGRVEGIDGAAMSLNFGPLKGQVSGANRGKQFLARTLTGVGTVAAFAVGRPGGFSLSGPVDNSILLRERVAQNIGIAGEQELMNLTDEFLRTLKEAGVESVKLPPRSPNLNAHAERFVRSIKESCLEQLILFGASSLRVAVRNFIGHYHSERNHQGLGNRLIQPEPDHLANTGRVQRRRRLGGMLNYYYRAAA